MGCFQSKRVQKMKSGPKRSSSITSDNRNKKRRVDDEDVHPKEEEDESKPLVVVSDEKKVPVTEEEQSFYWFIVPLAPVSKLPAEIYSAVDQAVEKHAYKVFNEDVLDELMTTFGLDQERCSVLMLVFHSFIRHEKMVASAVREALEQKESFQTLSSRPELKHISKFLEPLQDLPAHDNLKEIFHTLFKDILPSQNTLLFGYHTKTPNDNLSLAADDMVPFKIEHKEFDAKYYEAKRQSLALAHMSVLVLLSPRREYLGSIFMWASPVFLGTLALERISSSIPNLVSKKYRGLAQMLFRIAARYAKYSEFSGLSIYGPYPHIVKILQQVGFVAIHPPKQYLPTYVHRDLDRLLGNLDTYLIDHHVVLIPEPEMPHCAMPWEGIKDDDEFVQVFNWHGVPDKVKDLLVSTKIITTMVKNYPYYYLADLEKRGTFPIPWKQILDSKLIRDPKDRMIVMRFLKSKKNIEFNK